MNDMTYRDAFLFGLGQSMALIPGVSRSGGTITGQVNNLDFGAITGACSKILASRTAC